VGVALILMGQIFSPLQHVFYSIIPTRSAQTHLNFFNWTLYASFAIGLVMAFGTLWNSTLLHKKVREKFKIMLSSNAILVKRWKSVMEQINPTF